MHKITDFTISEGIPEMDHLIQAWLPEIEIAARDYVPNDRIQAFFLAALRLGAKSKSLEGFNLFAVIERSGYSRSTFFRLFEGYTGFLLNGYKLTCSLSIRVFAKHLSERAMTLDEFIAFSSDILYGANCTVPNEVTRALWQEAKQEHLVFHAHIKEVARVMHEYLKWNQATAHLAIEEDDILEFIRIIDWELLQARVDNSPHFPSVPHYWRLRRMLTGYLKQFEVEGPVAQIARG